MAYLPRRSSSLAFPQAYFLNLERRADVFGTHKSRNEPADVDENHHTTTTHTHTHTHIHTRRTSQLIQVRLSREDARTYQNRHVAVKELMISHKTTSSRHNKRQPLSITTPVAALAYPAQNNGKAIIPRSPISRQKACTSSGSPERLAVTQQ